MSEVMEFHKQLIADVQGEADVLGLVGVEAFFEKVGELLTEAGELNAADRAYYEGTMSGNPLRIDGYGGDPRDGDGVLSLILCDFDINPEIRILHKDRLKVMTNTLHRFLKASLRQDFREQLEETSSGFGIADLIFSRWKEIEKIKLIIVTNAESRTKADALEVQSVGDKPVTLSLWDLKRLKQYEEQGQERENLIIDFENEFGRGIPLLAASGGDASFESYLAVMPGELLASIYDKWGPRLLESNVRSFLQARGKVNKGIRESIREEPQMFFPYNNGLSVTADSIVTCKNEDGLHLVKAENLQIVNGGQTTASIHAAQRSCPNQLKEVHVQMKLTIVPSEKSELVVPRISEYANSQNKVNLADFFANHPFQIRMEELSRKVLMRGKDGYRDTKWFYERARGQYADERGRRTPSERKSFDAEFPRSQFLTKTELAKYENTWAGIPHVVSLGAQKNFAEFATSIGKKWGSNGNDFNELWFKRMVAKSIVFRTTERLVSNAPWYEGGYRANIVTYAIAKLVHDVGKMKMEVDIDRIWQQQEVPEELKNALSIAAAGAQEVITRPPQGVKNYSEWAKKEICWKWLSEKELVYDRKFDQVLISTQMNLDRSKKAKADSNLTAGIDLQMKVVELGPQFWGKLLAWTNERKMIVPREQLSLGTCAAMPAKTPSSQQCKSVMKVLERAQEKGFTMEA